MSFIVTGPNGSAVWARRLKDKASRRRMNGNRMKHKFYIFIANPQPMKQVLAVVFALVSLQACQTRIETSPSLETVLDSLLNSSKDFSGVVLVADKGKPVYHKAFGYVNRETKMPMDTTTLFELASVSKQFTAALIMMLQEEGKLSVDDPLEKYV